LNRVSKLVVLLFLATLICAVPVSAQTDQGFEWGFAYDDEFHFMMHLEGDGMLIDEEIYIHLNDTPPAIPDSMDNWTDIPYTGIWAYYANGTQLGIEILTFIAMYNAHLPIGNWALLSTLAQTTHKVENFTLDPEDPFFWGYSWEDDDWNLSVDGFTIYSRYTINVHVEYLKTDGFLTQYYLDSYNTTTKEKTGEITLDRLSVEKYRETTSPTTDHPDDITYLQGQLGNNITWHASDDNPSSYEILIDGILTRSGLWNITNEAITIVVDGLAVGDYNFTLVVQDIRGNSASDEVMVTVQAPTVLPLVLISVVVGAGILIVLAVVCRRR
jgi:hypothetical protein